MDALLQNLVSKHLPLNKESNKKKQLDNCIVFVFNLKSMAAFILKWSQYQVIQYTQASDNVFYIIQRINWITQLIHLQYLVPSIYHLIQKKDV